MKLTIFRWSESKFNPELRLLDLLKKSKNGRIITISSKGLLAKPFLKINYDDPELLNEKFSIVKSYYQSKLAQVMYTIWLSKELMGTNITVNSIRVPAVRIDVSKYPNLPGILKTMYKFKSRFSLSPAKMAETYVYLSVSEKVKNSSGLYFDENNKVLNYTKYQKSWVEIDKLMELSIKYLK